MRSYGRHMTNTTNDTRGLIDRADGAATERSEAFALSEAVARTYEAKFVPAVFAIWAPVLLDIVCVGPGDAVLDVACGTGVVARHAAERVAPGGSVTGVDLHPAMLTVASRLRPDVEWRQGDVATLPFRDGRFDVAVCQMAFMFFPDPDLAVREMIRVVRPGGRVAALVPAALDAQPAYRVFVDLAVRHAGPSARSLLGTYWNCGDLDRFTERFVTAGLDVRASVPRSKPARFDSVDDFVHTEIGSTPLVERLDPAAIERICADARVAMAQWGTDGGFEIPLVCNVVAASLPAA